MQDRNMTARELFQSYKRQYYGLVNSYCQLKQRYPFEKFPKLSRAIHKVGWYLEMWRRIAVVSNGGDK